MFLRLSWCVLLCHSVHLFMFCSSLFPVNIILVRSQVRVSQCFIKSLSPPEKPWHAVRGGKAEVDEQGLLVWRAGVVLRGERALVYMCMCYGYKCVSTLIWAITHARGRAISQRKLHCWTMGTMGTYYSHDVKSKNRRSKVICCTCNVFLWECFRLCWYIPPWPS